MAAQTDLTQWQRNHLDHVIILLQQAEETIRSLKTEERKAERGEEISSKTIWLKFRYIVFDLYSVLDYVYYFLYCHFSNGGQEAPIKDAVKLSFPYCAKEGVAISDSSGRDQTKTFVTEHRKRLCRTNPQKEKDAEAIVRYICELQPKRKLDDAGSQDLELPTADAECLAMLHYYRNCVTHRNLILFPPERTWVRFNEDRGCYEYVNESQKGESTYLQQLDGQRFWIKLPNRIKGNKFRLLVHVLDDLNRFGRKTVTKLLQLGGIQFEPPDAVSPTHLTSTQSTQAETSRGPSVDPPNNRPTPAEFLDLIRPQFTADVDASTIVLELENRSIISDGDQKTIRQEANATLQAQLLHACLKKKCDVKALTDVCDIIAKVEGNPRMKSFGEHMKMEWEKDDSPSDKDMSHPPAKKTKPTHSTSDPADST